MPIDTEMCEFLFFTEAEVFSVHFSCEVFTFFSSGRNGDGEEEDLCGEDENELCHVSFVMVLCFICC